MTEQQHTADAPETPNGAHVAARSEDGTPLEGTNTQGDPASSNGPASNAGSEDQGEQPQGDEQDTFPRSYVEQLRNEAATHRVRAQRSDELAAALWEARVAATGRLADPTDLQMPEDADPLDPASITASVDDLLERKPHLASRVPRGDAGQGYQKTERPFSLLGALNQAAR